jgi:uncharacterized caspase-like protein
MRFVLTLCAALMLALLNTAVQAAGRVALVIGNATYENANPLLNPVNDATAMAAALQNLGFTVISGTDLTFTEMGAKIGEFEEAARSAEVTFMFYAGHGMTVNGRNYLLPVNAKLERESTLQFEAIDSDTILNAMSGPGKTAVALLDACRNNPLSRNFSRSLGTRSAAVGQGLSAPTVAGDGMLIGFATAPGQTAADGEGQNSPFSTAMLKHINTPGLEIQSLMTRVKADVFSATNQEQQPWHNSSLRSEFYLVAPQQVEPPAPQPSNSVEAEWNAVKDANSVVALDAFIKAHAENPVFVALAQEQKDKVALIDTSKFLDSLKIPETPPQSLDVQSPIVKSEILKELALDNPKQAETAEVKRHSSFKWTLEKFFDAGKDANAGNTIFALLGTTTVTLPKPAKNPGRAVPSLDLQNIATAPNLEALLAAESALKFSTDFSTSCRLDFIEQCPFVPQSLVEMMDKAMVEKGMLMSNHNGNYFQINRLAGSDHFILSNSPAFGKGEVAIIAAIVSPDGDVKDMFGFDLSRERISVEAGDPESHVLLTWAAMEGDDLYVSFDSGTRCTETARKFGFIARFGMTERNVKWVSPYNVSDTNFVLSDDFLLSANGGSCVDDFAYRIHKNIGMIDSRWKVPKAVTRMDAQNGAVVFELYEGAAAYRWP